eukprot:COSAG02_NODE_620_length_19443_cov_91.259564_1_plen_60_part_00
MGAKGKASLAALILVFLLVLLVAIRGDTRTSNASKLGCSRHAVPTRGHAHQSRLGASMG